MEAITTSIHRSAMGRKMRNLRKLFATYVHAETEAGDIVRRYSFFGEVLGYNQLTI